MNIRPIVLLLALVSTVVLIGCSSAPEAPSAPVPNFFEREVISLVKDDVRCWWTKFDSNNSFTIVNFTHTESASFRPSGIWVVEAKSSWTANSLVTDTAKGKGDISHIGPFECIYVVDDATGEVTSKSED